MARAIMTPTASAPRTNAFDEPCHGATTPRFVRRLLALDLDGTLLRRDGSIHPRDVDAIQRARAAGVYVTLATGRLIGGTLPHARKLDLDGAMICGDGATTASAVTGEVLDCSSVDALTTEGIVATLRAHDLIPFVFSHGEIHADESARGYDEWVRIWSEQIHYHPVLADSHAWRTEGTVAMTLGLGEDAAVTAAHTVMDEKWGSRVLNTRFGFGERHMLRSFRPECSKGYALGRLAEKLGIPREQCVVVGDWYNDLSMFEFAGRSFAMAGAPDDVKRAATHRLVARAGEGCGVAEAIDRAF
jgi:Cof subfamily protein (haloacid dehalogenase superfamily)